MTRTAGHDHTMLPSQPQQVRVAKPTAQSRSAVRTHTIELCWNISTLASGLLLRDHAQACTRTDNTRQRDVTTVVLSIHPAKAGQMLTVTLEAVWHDGVRRVLIQEHPADCLWHIDHQYQLEHIDIAGVVRCTFAYGQAEDTRAAATSKMGRALFVRTPWLARVGIKPGTYALAGMRVHA